MKGPSKLRIVLDGVFFNNAVVNFGLNFVYVSGPKSFFFKLILAGEYKLTFF